MIVLDYLKRSFVSSWSLFFQNSYDSLVSGYYLRPI